ncbi:MAG: hypothetical protein AAGA56_15905, partial [Myxococcota bacterium]
VATEANPDAQTSPDEGELNDGVPDPDGDSTSPDPLAAPPSASEVGGGIPGLGGPHVGVPGTRSGPPDRSPAPTRAPKREFDPDQGSRAVADKMREKDKKLGLDFPGRGPIRIAFTGATYSSGTPYEGSANFSVSVSPQGKVTNVTLLSYTGGSGSAWDTVRAQAKAQLASAKLPMQSAYAKGANVGVLVKSSKKSPSGGDGVKRDGASLNFDVADIGSRATRYVSVFVNAQPVR